MKPVAGETNLDPPSTDESSRQTDLKKGVEQFEQQILQALEKSALAVKQIDRAHKVFQELDIDKIIQQALQEREKARAEVQKELSKLDIQEIVNQATQNLKDLGDDDETLKDLDDETLE